MLHPGRCRRRLTWSAWILRELGPVVRDTARGRPSRRQLCPANSRPVRGQGHRTDEPNDRLPRMSPVDHPEGMRGIAPGRSTIDSPTAGGPMSRTARPVADAVGDTVSALVAVLSVSAAVAR